MFSPGDEIVCINPAGVNRELHRGGIYTVRDPYCHIGIYKGVRLCGLRCDGDPNLCRPFKATRFRHARPEDYEDAAATAKITTAALVQP